MTERGWVVNVALCVCCRFNDGTFDEDEDEEGEAYEEGEAMDMGEVQADLRQKRYARKKEKIIPLADINNVRAKFQNLNSSESGERKPVRHITPPRIKALYEIENTPAERAEGVVGANDKIEDVKPTAVSWCGG